jgi:FlaA1/EpsC-like NDP-sugar epimerase
MLTSVNDEQFSVLVAGTGGSIGSELARQAIPFNPSRLILQAGALGEGGEIFILHMGTPVCIADMARDLIRLSGKEPDTEIKIEFTGIRPGEKLYEELITDGEGIVKTRHEKIMVLRPESVLNDDWIQNEVGILQELVVNHSAAGIKSHLKEIIPEYDAQTSTSVL